MNKNRIKLQNKLEEILGSRNVYYQPPESIKMEYPAIVYSKNNVKGTFADDKRYSKNICYEVIVIDKKPDNPVIDNLLDLSYCSFDCHYKSDNLNHDVFILYW